MVKNKLRFNLIGNTFTHLSGGNKGYSVHGKESKYIEWISNLEHELDTFFIDDYIESGYKYSSPGRKYGWLLESKWISPAINNVKNSDWSLISQYDAIFTHDKELLDKGHPFKFVPAQGSWIANPVIHQKTKLVSMISSGKNWTDGHKFRVGWIENHKDKLDLYGRGFNEILLKEEGLCDYMFSVAIENGSYETYFTEKLLDCFLTGTIPIYYGAPDIGSYFNMDGILSLDEFDKITPELYHSKIDAVKDNFERALKMEILEDYIYINYLTDRK